MDVFVQLDAWLSSLVFAALMLVGWWVGSRVRRARAPQDESTRIEDASLALFGLLLAFCFSGAASRYELRKELLRDDAIAIGEVATVAAVLEDPERGELKRELRAYVQQRLTFGTMRLDDAAMPRVIGEGREAHNRMEAIVKRAVATKNTPTVHTPLLNALNGLTAAHDKRLYGIQNQVPVSIVLMLVLLGVFTTFTMGRLHDQGEKRATSLFRIGSYTALVALVFAVTVDLEQPRRGMMRVSQAPMQDLLTALSAPSH